MSRGLSHVDLACSMASSSCFVSPQAKFGSVHQGTSFATNVTLRLEAQARRVLHVKYPWPAFATALQRNNVICT